MCFKLLAVSVLLSSFAATAAPSCGYALELEIDNRSTEDVYWTFLAPRRNQKGADGVARAWSNDVRNLSHRGRRVLILKDATRQQFNRIVIDFFGDKVVKINKKNGKWKVGVMNN
jgi:hypothetical protein